MPINKAAKEIIEAIEDIIKTIPKKNCFDSHFVIQLLIEKYSDEYSKFVATYSDSGNVTRTAHAQIGKQIQKVCSDKQIKQVEKSYSHNIHHKASKCTIYQK